MSWEWVAIGLLSLAWLGSSAYLFWLNRKGESQREVMAQSRAQEQFLLWDRLVQERQVASGHELDRQLKQLQDQIQANHIDSLTEQTARDALRNELISELREAIPFHDHAGMGMTHVHAFVARGNAVGGTTVLECDVPGCGAKMTVSLGA